MELFDYCNHKDHNIETKEKLLDLYSKLDIKWNGDYPEYKGDKERWIDEPENIWKGYGSDSDSDDYNVYDSEFKHYVEYLDGEKWVRGPFIVYKKDDDKYVNTRKFVGYKPDLDKYKIDDNELINMDILFKYPCQKCAKLILNTIDKSGNPNWLLSFIKSVEKYIDDNIVINLLKKIKNNKYQYIKAYIIYYAFVNNNYKLLLYIYHHDDCNQSATEYGLIRAIELKLPIADKFLHNKPISKSIYIKLAVYFDDISYIERMIEKTKFGINKHYSSADPYNFMPYYYNIKIIRYIKEKFELGDHTINHEFDQACIFNKFDVVKLLTENFKDIINADWGYKKAATHNYFNIAGYILNNYKLENQTHSRTASYSCISMLTFLIKHNIEDNHYRSSRRYKLLKSDFLDDLLEICQEENVDITKYALDKSIYTTYVTLDDGLKYKNSKILDYMLDNYDREKIFKKACQLEDRKIVDNMINKFNLKYQPQDMEVEFLNNINNYRDHLDAFNIDDNLSLINKEIKQSIIRNRYYLFEYFYNKFDLDLGFYFCMACYNHSYILTKILKLSDIDKMLKEHPIIVYIAIDLVLISDINKCLLTLDEIKKNYLNLLINDGRFKISKYAIEYAKEHIDY